MCYPLPMTHTETLNLILANSCPSETWTNADGTVTYKFGIVTHCVEWEVTATLASTMNTIQYNIISAIVV